MNRNPRQRGFYMSAVKAMEGVVCADIYADGEQCMTCGAVVNTHYKYCRAVALLEELKRLSTDAGNEHAEAV